MCIETAGGSFIVQCAHWAIPLFCFLLSRRRKQNACKSPLSPRRKNGLGRPNTNPWFDLDMQGASGYNVNRKGVA